MSSWADYYINDYDGGMHTVTFEGSTITCDYIHCDYRETFDTIDDAEVAGEIHSQNPYEPDYEGYSDDDYYNED